MVESGQKRARDLLARVVEEEGSLRKAQKRLGVGVSMRRGILKNGRGAGVTVLEALAREFPSESSGLVNVSPERAATAAPLHPMDAPLIPDARARAVRAYVELHPEVSLEDAERIARWAELAKLDPAPHAARWWLARMDEVAELWRQEDTRIRGA